AKRRGPPGGAADHARRGSRSCAAAWVVGGAGSPAPRPGLASPAPARRSEPRPMAKRDASHSEVIRAAGGLVWRESPRGRQIAVVHRPKYDDWTLPKGKLDPGESWQDGAVREVA